MEPSPDGPLRLDPALESTWKASTTFVATCLDEERVQDALPIVVRLRPHMTQASLWSEYFPLAAAVFARTGRIAEAVDVVRAAYRIGYHKLWYFEGAYGGQLHFDAGSQAWRDASGRDPHADDSHGIYRIHRYLMPLYQNHEVARIVASYRQEHAASLDRGIDRAPLCWLEDTTLTRAKSRCALSRARLEKGAAVVAFRLFNGSRDLPTVPLVADAATFAQSPEAQDNARKYRTDGYRLSEFAFGRQYAEPWVNAALLDPSAFDANAALEYLSSPPERPTPYGMQDSSGEHAYDGDAIAAHGENRVLVDFLWMMVKSGHLATIERRLPELPRHFALLLLLFDRPVLRARVAERLGIPEALRVYEVLGKPRIGPADIAALARLGEERPDFQRLLAASLATYEYHLYNNYRPSPNWFFQDFGYLVRARAGNLLYVLASNPDLVPPLAEMLAGRRLVAGHFHARDYADMRPFFYGAALLHAATRRPADLPFWRAVPEAHRAFRDLSKVRDRVMRAVALA